MKRPREKQKPRDSGVNSLFVPAELEFPFHDDVRPAESGQGYALRMAAENHLNGLPQLKGWLGKSRFATLDAEDAPLLSQWFGASTDRLEHALGWTTIGRGGAACTYAGQVLGRSYFLNRSYPRVCLLCFQANGHCHSAWDFALAVACAKHQVLLADRCDCCTRTISWNRPATHRCSCHMDLEPREIPILATPLEVQFSSWLDRKIAGDRNAADAVRQQSSACDDAPENSTPLMRLVWPLSLNGGMRVIYALATAAGYEESCPSNEPRARSPLRKAQGVLSKADQFARRIGQTKDINLRVRRPSVVIQLLADCMSGQEPPADRNLAQSVLGTVLRQKQKTRWCGVNPQLSQLVLF